jgi:radical SAM superfamily enzyme YgiQ (UPF0313 family)
MVGDALARAGHAVGYADRSTVQNFDLILVSITSDCDWWTYIAERSRWVKGAYIVVVGGAGVLNVRPFLKWGDVFVLGRGEKIIPELADQWGAHSFPDHPSVIYPPTFDAENQSYWIAQSPELYPHPVPFGEKEKTFVENNIGCPHKCLFCGYSWHRKHVGGDRFEYRVGPVDLSKREYTLKDIISLRPDPSKIVTTAIDGLSEKLRKKVNKPILNSEIISLLEYFATGKPHRLKIFNIVGYPGETQSDYDEFKSTLMEGDLNAPKIYPQTGLILHSTPFRAVPATPCACWPMEYINFRGGISKRLGAGGNAVFYKGNSYYAIESMGTESLPSVILSAIAIRGTETDAANVEKLSITKKFWGADQKTKRITLEKYFDVKSLFGPFDPASLPTRYLKTYAKINYSKVD